MTKKKFWVHYSKHDGPRSKSMELTSLTDLLPRMNVNCATPLWFVKDDSPNCSWIDYRLYAQLTDKVAVSTTFRITDYNVEEMLTTDDQFKAQANGFFKYDLSRAKTEDERKAVQDKIANNIQGRIDERENKYKRLAVLSDFTYFLLTQASWITESELNAYREINSPFLTTLQVLRQAYIEQAEIKERQRAEERKREEEEEARKRAEEDRREQERLTNEAKKFKEGGFIKGDDVVELCRRYGIDVHLRTVHNLQQVVTNIRGKDVCCNYHCPSGKRTPKLDGCFKTAKTLYEYLQAHEDLKAA